MKITRIYTGEDNQSHFEDIDIHLKDGGKGGFMSELMRATGIVFRETDGSYDYDFHNAPRRQYVINLEGEVEIELGDGTKRILHSGDILLAEDTTGQGHWKGLMGDKPYPIERSGKDLRQNRKELLERYNRSLKGTDKQTKLISPR